ncbi:uncharacterized protein LOC115455229 [Manduca sexta]|uniref:uncharacterized protein LOC115455229 n=1 Tax=Manduca sexta TaxID=7130 RepID=UPI00188E7EAA|nr:uncharacterized protein LOC115455229 [Manduca sexta]
MTKYFHDKISLLKKCSLEGAAAISCVIRGLPVELQANAKAYSCDTAEELYYGFLSSLENYKKLEAKSSDSKSTWQRGTATNIAPKICYNCRKTGHEIRDCKSVRCQICQRLGHSATSCWYAAGTSQTVPRTAQYTTTQQQGIQAPQRPMQLPKMGDNPIDRRGPRQLQDGRM